MKAIDHASLLKTFAGRGDLSEVYEERTTFDIIENDTGKIEKCLQLTEQGTSLRTFSNGNIAFTASNCLNERDIIAKHKNALKDPDTAETPPVLNHKKLIREFSYSTPFGQYIGLTNAITERLKKELPALKNSRIVVQRTKKSFAVSNSTGRYIASATAVGFIAIHITCAPPSGSFTVFEKTGYSFKELSDDDIENIVALVIARARLMEKARPGPAGTFPCVLSAEAGGTMIHEAVGHGLEADLIDKGVSIYKDKLGSKVASSLVTVTDDSTYETGYGSFLCDDEGTPAHRTVLIDKGVLTSYLYDLYYAQKHNVRSTGNGRRQSYLYKPYPRMTNTMIVPGTDNAASLLASLDKGVLVKKMGGGQVNTLTGDFIFAIQEGFWVEKGEIVYPIKDCSLIGNGPAILQEIDGVASDFGTSLGTCGKEGQGVPVGDGQPTIRIPKITIGGTAFNKGSR